MSGYRGYRVILVKLAKQTNSHLYQSLIDNLFLFYRFEVASFFYNGVYYKKISRLSYAWPEIGKDQLKRKSF